MTPLHSSKRLDGQILRIRDIGDDKRVVCEQWTKSKKLSKKDEHYTTTN